MWATWKHSCRGLQHSKQLWRKEKPPGESCRSQKPEALCLAPGFSFAGTEIASSTVKLGTKFTCPPHCCVLAVWKSCISSALYFKKTAEGGMFVSIKASKDSRGLWEVSGGRWRWVWHFVLWAGWKRGVLLHSQLSEGVWWSWLGGPCRSPVLMAWWVDGVWFS